MYNKQKQKIWYKLFYKGNFNKKIQAKMDKKLEQIKSKNIKVYSKCQHPFTSLQFNNQNHC